MPVWCEIPAADDFKPPRKLDTLHYLKREHHKVNRLQFQVSTVPVIERTGGREPLHPDQGQFSVGHGMKRPLTEAESWMGRKEMVEHDGGHRELDQYLNVRYCHASPKKYQVLV